MKSITFRDPGLGGAARSNMTKIATKSVIFGGTYRSRYIIRFMYNLLVILGNPGAGCPALGL